MSDFTANDTVIPSIEHDAPNGIQNAKTSIVNGASSAADTIKNHPITQNISNGPVADSIKDQHAKTSTEFSNLAASKTTPRTPAATGQPLTQYHSFFYSLLSWQHPRASGIAYLSTVLFIFAARYLDILRYTFKATYMILAVTVLAEALGKAVLSTGLTTQIRPRKYYTVSRETLNSFIGDVHELINFFVIEAQQIVFAENLLASTAALFAAFLSYYLIKVVPFWGLSLMATTVLFGVPLIYTTNQELIDEQLENVSQLVSKQTEQVKSLASQHASSVTESTKHLVGDYSAKAQEMIGNARGRSVSPTLSKAAPVKTEAPAYKTEDFPNAPKEEFKSTPIADEMSSKSEEPLIAS
jgi:hypothetical protein